MYFSCFLYDKCTITNVEKSKSRPAKSRGLWWLVRSRWKSTFKKHDEVMSSHCVTEFIDMSSQEKILWWHTRVLSCSSRLSQASSFLCASLHKQHGEQEGVVHDGERHGSPARVMSFSSAVRRRSSLEEHDERDRSGSAPIFLCPRASINGDWRQWVPLRTSCRDGRRRTLAS